MNSSIKMLGVSLTILFLVTILATLLALVFASASENYIFSNDLYVSDFEQLWSLEGENMFRAYITKGGAGQAPISKIVVRINSHNGSDDAYIWVEIPMLTNDAELDSLTFTFDTRPVATRLKYEAQYDFPIEFHPRNTGYGNVFSVKNLGWLGEGVGTTVYKFILTRPTNVNSSLAFSADLSMHQVRFLQLTRLNAHAFGYLQIPWYTRV